MPRDRLKERLNELVEGRSQMVAEFFRSKFPVPTERKLTAQERASAFIQMPQDVKQRLFLEMGKDEWPKFVMEELNNALKVYGPGVASAAPYFVTGLPEQVEPGTANPDFHKQTLETLLGIPFPELEATT